MTVRRLHILIGLAMAVAAATAIAPTRAATLAAVARASDLPAHAHQHEHTHGGTKHVHVHHHHAGDPGGDPGGESDDHHGVLDHLPDTPHLQWTASRRAGVDGPPPGSQLPAATVRSIDDWPPARPAKPPPRMTAARACFGAIGTVVLRL